MAASVSDAASFDCVCGACALRRSGRGCNLSDALGMGHLISGTNAAKALQFRSNVSLWIEV
jgi:hypothetical protein